LDFFTSVSLVNKLPKLQEEFPINPSFCTKPWGHKANIAKIPFKLKGQIERIFWSFAFVPMAWYKGDGFTGNFSYKLGLISQQSHTRANIPKHASGSIS